MALALMSDRILVLKALGRTLSTNGLQELVDSVYGNSMFRTFLIIQWQAKAEVQLLNSFQSKEIIMSSAHFFNLQFLRFRTWINLSKESNRGISLLFSKMINIKLLISIMFLLLDRRIKCH